MLDKLFIAGTAVIAVLGVFTAFLLLDMMCALWRGPGHCYFY